MRKTKPKPKRKVQRLDRTKFLEFLRHRHACLEAMRWVLDNPTLSPSELWYACPDWGWLSWLADEVDIDYDPWPVFNKDARSKSVEKATRAVRAINEAGILPGPHRMNAEYHLDKLQDAIRLEIFRQGLSWLRVERAILRAIQREED